MKNKRQPRSTATVFTWLLMLFLLIFSTPVLAQDSQIPGAAIWISILPPLLAILLALTLRQVSPALFAGVWLGAGLLYLILNLLGKSARVPSN